MKLLAIMMIGALPWASALAREFKSSDGKQTTEAEFIRYNSRAEQVTLRMPNGRNMIIDAKLFSEEDRKFFMEQAIKEELATAVTAKARDRITRNSETRDQLVYSLSLANYSILVENSSELVLENLTVKYWIVVERDNQGKPTNETFAGDGLIKTLPSKGEESIVGPVIKLITGAVLQHDTKDEKLFKKALAVGRDRVLGHRVEVHAADGKLLYGDSSSTKVDKVLGLDKKK